MFLAQVYLNNGLNMFNKAIRNLNKGIELMCGQADVNKRTMLKLENKNSELYESIAKHEKILENLENIMK